LSKGKAVDEFGASHYYQCELCCLVVRKCEPIKLSWVASRVGQGMGALDGVPVPQEEGEEEVLGVFPHCQNPKSLYYFGKNFAEMSCFHIVHVHRCKFGGVWSLSSPDILVVGHFGSWPRLVCRILAGGYSGISPVSRIRFRVKVRLGTDVSTD